MEIRIKLNSVIFIQPIANLLSDSDLKSYFSFIFIIIKLFYIESPGTGLVGVFWTRYMLLIHLFNNSLYTKIVMDI